MPTKAVSLFLILFLSLWSSTIFAQPMGDQAVAEAAADGDLHVISATHYPDRIMLRLGGRTVGAGVVVYILERTANGAEHASTAVISRTGGILIGLSPPHERIGVPVVLTISVDGEIVEFEM